MSTLDKCYNIADLRLAAQKRLPKAVFEFVDRGTEDEVGMRNNRRSFEKIKLTHRALVDVTKRSMRTTLFGRTSAMPLAMAPTGIAGMCWYQGELAVARAAAAADVPFTLSMGALTAMEEISQAGGRQWFQLFLWKERIHSYELIERAKKNGFEALIVTVDTPVNSTREYNLRNGFLYPFRATPRFVFDMLRHPTWVAKVLSPYLLTTGLPRFENHPSGFQHNIRGDAHAMETMRRDDMNWDDVTTIRKMWSGPLMLKGINKPEDARRAVQLGCDAVIVSNHGGRNMDSAAATIDVLPRIVDAVADKAVVLLDSGIRRGSDIAKALALGAKGVMSGRAPLYGVAAGGEAGALKAIKLIGQEFDKTMAYCGCNDVSQINADILF